MRGLPFPFAYIEMFIASGASPVDAARGLSREEAPVLPEIFPRAGALSAVQPMDDGGGDAARLEDQARHALRERASLAARALRCPDLVLIRALPGRCHALSDASLEPTDDAFHGLAVGARGEGERHAVLEDRLGHRHDVVDRRREPPVDEGAGARDQHQRLARARTWTPGDQLAEFAGFGPGAGRAHEVEDRFHDRFTDR